MNRLWELISRTEEGNRAIAIDRNKTQLNQPGHSQREQVATRSASTCGLLNVAALAPLKLTHLPKNAELHAGNLILRVHWFNLLTTNVQQFQAYHMGRCPVQHVQLLNGPVQHQKRPEAREISAFFECRVELLNVFGAAQILQKRSTRSTRVQIHPTTGGNPMDLSVEQKRSTGVQHVQHGEENK